MTDGQEGLTGGALIGEPEGGEEAKESDQCVAYGCRAPHPLYMFKPIQASSARSAFISASVETQGWREACPAKA